MAASFVERMKPSLYQQHLQHIGNTASLYSDFRCPDPSCCHHHKPLMDVFDHPWNGNGGHPLMEFQFGMQNPGLTAPHRIWQTERRWKLL